MNIHYFGILFLAWVRVSHGSPDEEPCGKPADIAFILDSSRSIPEDKFLIEKEFVSKIVDTFEVGPGKTQVAGLQFAQNVQTEFLFNEVSDKDSAKDKVIQIKQSFGGATYTHKALEQLTSKIFKPENGAREKGKVPRIAILLSDGASTNPWRTQSTAKKAKEEGITLLAIGIGKKVNATELEGIVTVPHDKNYFPASNFNELENFEFQQLVSQQACKVIPTTTPVPTTTTKKTPISTPQEYVSTTTEEMSKDEPKDNKTCQGKAADVLFILDMSSSIWTEDFKVQLKFVKDLIGEFDIESGKTQIGAVAFSDNATTVFDLDQYKTKSEITDAVLNIKSAGGITNTHKALNLALDQVFTAEYGARPDVAHICILITDGRSSLPEDTLKSVEKIHKHGIYLFVIGVGNMTDNSELAKMASKPTKEYMFKVNAYKALPTLKTILKTKACSVPQGDQPRCIETVQADIVFGLYNIGGENKASVATFVRSFGSGFDLPSGNVRIGLKEGCSSGGFDLTTFDIREDYYSMLQDSMATELGSFMYDIRRTFPRNSMKSSINKYTVLLVSGDAAMSDKAKAELDRLMTFSKVIVVGIGDEVKKEQLMQLASPINKGDKDDSHVIMVDKFSQLQFAIKQLYELVCSEQ